LPKTKAGQHLSGIFVNRAFATENPLIFRPNSAFGNTANVDQHYIAAHYAAALPDHAYVSLDLPAHGASDGLTKEQRKDIIKKNGSLDSVADAQIEALQDLVPDIKDVILTGEAAGELAAITFAARAAAKGIQTRYLFGFDPLGMEKRSVLGLVGGYLFKAQQSRNERRKPSDDAGQQRLQTAYDRFTAEMAKLGPVKTVSRVESLGALAKERTIARLMLRKSPITHDSGMRALEAALETQPELKAYFVFGGQSVVGRLTEDVEERLHGLKNQYEDRVNWSLWPHDGQDIGLAPNQPRAVAFVKDRLNQDNLQ
jgi:pimeloyl-ACP methyl ester carboxylesterase